jgi:hypothetical protein
VHRVLRGSAARQSARCGRARLHTHARETSLQSRTRTMPSMVQRQIMEPEAGPG